MQFYLLFAVVVWRGLTLRRAMWFGYGWLVFSAIAVSSDLKLLTFVLQPEFAPLFVAGIAFFLIHRFGSSLRLWGLVAASFLLAQHNVVARVESTAKTNIKAPLSSTIGILIVATFFAVLAVIALGWTTRTGVLALMLLAAWLMHRWIERPLAAFLRSHLTPASRPQPPMPSRPTAVAARHPSALHARQRS